MATAPEAPTFSFVGRDTPRVDGRHKVTGTAPYTSDFHFPGLLYAVPVEATIANGQVVKLDTAAAEKMPGVKAVEIIQKIGTTAQWAGDEIVAVAAVDESTAEDAVRLIKVSYQPMSYLVSDAEPPAGAGEAHRRSRPALLRRAGRAGMTALQLPRSISRADRDCHGVPERV